MERIHPPAGRASPVLGHGGQWPGSGELEVQQLGFLTRDRPTHREIRRGAAARSLWRRLGSSGA